MKSRRKTKNLAFFLVPFVLAGTQLASSCGVKSESFSSGLKGEVERIANWLKEMNKAVDHECIFNLKTLKEDEQTDILKDLAKLNVVVPLSTIDKFKAIPQNIKVSVTKNFDDNNLNFKIFAWDLETSEEINYVQKIQIRNFTPLPDNYTAQEKIAEKLFKNYLKKTKFADYHFKKLIIGGELSFGGVESEDSLFLEVPNAIKEFVKKSSLNISVSKSNGDSHQITWTVANKADNLQKSTFTNDIEGKYSKRKSILSGVNVHYATKKFSIGGVDYDVLTPLNLLLVDNKKKNAIFVGGEGGKFDFIKIDGTRFDGIDVQQLPDFEATGTVNDLHFNNEGNVWIGGAKSNSLLLTVSEFFDINSSIEKISHGFKDVSAVLTTDTNGGFLSVDWDKNRIARYSNDIEGLLATKNLEVVDSSRIIQILPNDNLNDGILVVYQVVLNGEIFSRIYKLNKNLLIDTTNWKNPDTKAWVSSSGKTPWIISYIQNDVNGGYWVGGLTGELVHLDRYGNKNGEITKTSSKRIISIASDGEDGIYVTVEGGILRKYVPNFDYSKIEMRWEQRMSDDDFMQIYKDSDGFYYLLFGNSADKSTHVLRLAQDLSDTAW